MGTSWSVRLQAARSLDLHALHAAIQDRLGRIVAEMSTWREDSCISAYNRASAGTWLDIPVDFHAVLACALRVAAASDGAFDPSIGPMVRAWGFGAHASGRDLPGRGALEAARSSVGWHRIRLREEPRQVLQPGNLELDLSAIAKGRGVDVVVALLRSRGITAALVEVGGELHGYGRKPDATPWFVLVEAGPEEADHALPPRVLALDGMAIATSGDRWHHYERGGRRYTHTIDPRSGEPVPHAPTAVTVLADDAMHADAWATALAVLGQEAGLALAERIRLPARYLWRGQDGTMQERMSSAFEGRLAA